MIFFMSFHHLILPIFSLHSLSYLFFFLKDRAPPEIYPFSLHAPLPISHAGRFQPARRGLPVPPARRRSRSRFSRIFSSVWRPKRALAMNIIFSALVRRMRISLKRDRKSTRLNSSHT